MMYPLISEKNTLDENENPTGGHVAGIGFTIVWQDGPLGRGAERKNPNGAFVESVILASLSRLSFFQRTKFACQENKDAIYHLEQALAALNSRTERRQAAGVEGTYAG